jgi:UDP-N-acetylmuramoyl-L-alanyl-D-glutamate--2,6-diaminopimelate ligase
METRSTFLIKLKGVLRRIVPEKIWNLGHLALAYTAAGIYGFPSRSMVVIGVTGTNGKSTTVEMLHSVLAEFGFRVAALTSLHEHIMGVTRPRGMVGSLKNTMPGRFALQNFLRRAKRTGCQLVVLEVTSQGILQYRHRGVAFDGAVLTNLRPEHIESHGSFENYRAAKGKLFRALRWRIKRGVPTMSIVNLDDPSAFYYAQYGADRRWGFGLQPASAREHVDMVCPTQYTFMPDGTVFTYGGLTWRTPLVGEFNLTNTLCALAVGQALGVPLRVLQRGMAKLRHISGRLEIVQSSPFYVVVDYAHTPDALEAVYRLAREQWAAKKGRVIAVLGSAGGGRDKWKRVEFGKIVDRFCDVAVLTNEDPYEEDPTVITAEIARGIRSISFETVPDRADAIARAVAIAHPGDAVVITGKGSEHTFITKEAVLPWSDREAAERALGGLRTAPRPARVKKKSQKNESR